MSSNDSDVPVIDDDDPDLFVLEIDDILKDIKNIINEDSSSKDNLENYISDIEKKISIKQKLEVKKVDRELIRKLILKHPYFKNYCNYSIRLITIMKYLKKKGVEINIKDMDSLVEEIILSIDNIEKIGYGKYFKKR